MVNVGNIFDSQTWFRIVCSVLLPLKIWQGINNQLNLFDHIIWGICLNFEISSKRFWLSESECLSVIKWYVKGLFLGNYWWYFLFGNLNWDIWFSAYSYPTSFLDGYNCCKAMYQELFKLGGYNDLGNTPSN